MTKEQIYEAICDIAEDAGVTPEELIRALEEQSGAKFEESIGTLPEDAAKLVKNARDEKALQRAERRKAEKDGILNEEIKRFRKLFPDVAAESIPDSVWADMEKGIPLSYAYALYVLTDGDKNRYAKGVNERNTEASPPPLGENADESEISMEEVEAMSPSAVKKNFSRILRSIGKWKIN